MLTKRQTKVEEANKFIEPLLVQPIKAGKVSASSEIPYLNCCSKSRFRSLTLLKHRWDTIQQKL